MKCKLLSGLIILLFALIFVFVCGTNVPKVLAEEYRHHKAHAHGVAHLNVAVEGNDLYIELFSPAANIVGFEHHPRTEKQKAAVNKAIEKLQAGEALFVFSPGAEGKLTKSKVDTAGGSGIWLTQLT